MIKTKNISLWDLTRCNNINNANKDLTIKEIASQIRKHIKKRFPFCKFSVRSSTRYKNINIEILSSPFKTDSKYLTAIQDYCTNFIKSYQYCINYDPYGDYGSSYNFYGYVRISYDYQQTEQTNDIIAMIKEFDKKQKEYEKAEQKKLEKEWEEQLKQREQEEREYQKQLQQEQKQQQFINDNITAKDLKDDKQYFIKNCCFANLNKNDCLDDYITEVNKGDYTTNDVKITREIHFIDKKALKYFSNNLLTDFDFLKNTGGCASDDGENYYRLGVAIYYNDQLQFVIDTQGYSYARYVGLTDGATNEKPKQTINKQNNNVIDITAKIQQRKEQEDLKKDIERFKNEYLPHLTKNDLQTLLNVDKEKWGEELVKICMRIDLEKMLQDQL